MTSRLQRFVAFNENGSRIEIVDIPSDIKGDDEAELEYAKDMIGPDDIVLSAKDGLDAANEIINELLDFKQMHKQTLAVLKDFVRDNYGQSELDNPSWDLDALANCMVQNNAFTLGD